jgi:hypothetical protein
MITDEELKQLRELDNHLIKKLLAEREVLREFVEKITDLTYEPYRYLDKTQIVRDAYDLQQALGQKES